MKSRLLIPVVAVACYLALVLSRYGERLGLVIGNRDYANTGRFRDLAATLNDAALMHRLLT